GKTLGSCKNLLEPNSDTVKVDLSLRIRLSVRSFPTEIWKYQLCELCLQLFFFSIAFPAYLAMRKTTIETIRKSIITPTKSPTAKFIPSPIGIVITAFFQLPPGIRAPGTGIIMSWTRAETTFPMYEVAYGKIHSFSYRYCNNGIFPIAARNQSPWNRHYNVLD